MLFYKKLYEEKEGKNYLVFINSMLENVSYKIERVKIFLT